LRKIQCLLSTVNFSIAKTAQVSNGFCNAIKFLIAINFFDRH